jgi:hypothetical protein
MNQFDVAAPREGSAQAAVINYFLKVDLVIKQGVGHWVEFNSCSEQLLIKMRTALPTWTLIAACSAVTGVPNTVLHLWQISDANSVLEGMLYFGENNPLYSRLAACCEEQRQELFTSMRYNPLGRNVLP